MCGLSALSSVGLSQWFPNWGWITPRG